MIKNIINIIFNLFDFKKPAFAYLNYIDLVINNKAYFLLTWRLENAFKLEIKNLKFVTLKKGGSAYILIPNEIEFIELFISNVWISEKKLIKLIRTTISEQIDFIPKRQFTELSPNSLYNPQLNLVLKKPVLQMQIKGVKIPPIPNN